MAAQNIGVERSKPVETKRPDLANDGGVVVDEVNKHSNVMNVVLSTINDDIARLRGGDKHSDSASKFLVELGQEAKVVEAGFWGKIAKIVHQPLESVKSYFQAREESALAITDNPDVIAEIIQELNRSKSKRRKLEEKLIKAGVEKDQVYLQVISDSEPGQILDDAHSLLLRANKQDFKKWENIQYDIDSEYTSQINFFISRGQLSELTKIWLKLSNKKQEEEVERFAGDIIYCGIKKLEENSIFLNKNIESFVERKRLYDSWFDSTVGSIEIPYLKSALLKNYQHTTEGFFSYDERNLLNNSDKVNSTIQLLDKKIQNRVLFSMTDKEKNRFWISVLSHPDGLEMAEIYANNKIIERSISVEKLSQMMSRYSLDEIAVAFDKVSPKYPDYVTLSASEFEGVVVLAVCGIEPSFIVKLDSIKLESIGALSRIYSADEMKALCAPEALEDYLVISAQDIIKDKTDQNIFEKEISPAAANFFSEIPNDQHYYTIANRNGKQINQNDGIQGRVDIYVKLQQTLKRIPEKFHDEIFRMAVHKNDNLPYYAEPTSEEFVENFLFYHRDVAQGLQFVLNDLFKDQEIFVGERWLNIKNGIDSIKTKPVFENVRDKKYALTLFELVGKTSDEKINDVVFKFLSAHDEVVGLQHISSSETVYKKESRTSNDIVGMYDFAESCKVLFKSDLNEMGKFLEFDEVDLQIISSFLSGRISLEEYVDLPIIEGRIACMGRTIVHHKENSEKFVALETKQKQAYLDLRQMYGYIPDSELFEYAQNNIGAKIVKTNKLLKCNPAIEQAAKLSEIENLGIVYYFKSNFSNYLDGDIFNRILNKCAELQSLGLDSTYYLSEPADDDHSIDMGDEVLNRFLEVPSDFIVKASQILKKYGLHQNLRSFIYLDAEDLNDFELRVRSAQIDTDGDRYVSRYTQVIPEKHLVKIESRFKEIQTNCPGLKMYTGDYKYLKMGEEEWEGLLTKPDILRLFMESDWRDFPGFTVSDSVLRNPLFWKHLIPSEIYLNDELLNNHLTFIQYTRTHNLIFASPSDLSGWTALYGIFEKAKTIFPDEILHDCSLYLLSRYTNKDSAKLLEFANLFTLDTKTSWYDVNEVMKKISSWPPEKKLLINNIRVLAGSTLPVTQFDVFEKLMDQYHDAETIIEQMDNKENITSSRYFDWSKFRIDTQLVKFTEDKFPTAYQMYSREEAMPFLKELINLDETAFENLEKLAQLGKKSQDFYGLRYFSEQLLVIARHPNFETVYNFLSSTETSSRSLCFLPTDQVGEFCDSVDHDTLDRFVKLSEFGNIDLGDLIKFLRYPNDVDKFTEFAQKLHDIFGKKISIRDYFLMDTQRVNNTLEYLQTHALIGLSEQNLQRILVISEGQMESDIKLVLASFDSKQDISTEESIEKLLSVPAEFRWSILKEKSSNFGWELLNQKDKLYQLGLSEEQLEELWVTLYKKSGLPTGTSFDVRTARLLLKHQNKYYNGQQNDVIYHILRNRAEPISQYYDIFKEEKESVGNFLSYLYEDSDLWKDEVCLSIFLQTNFDRFAAQLNHINPEFIISNGHEIIEKIKLSNPKISLDFYIECAEKKIEFKSEIRAELLEEIINKTLISTAENCHYVLDQSAKGIIILSDEQKSKLADRYLSQGGYLPDENQYDDQAKKEINGLILGRAEILMREWKENKNIAIAILSRFLKQKKFTNDHLDLLHAIMQQTDVGGDVTNDKEIFNVFVEYLIYIDPSIKDTLSNSNKMGKLKDIVVAKIIEYIQSINIGGKLNHDEIHLAVHKKLQEISRVFSSTNTKESDKRLIFMDMYNLKRCNDPAMKDLSAEDIMGRLRRDIEEVVMLSGSEFQILSMQRELDLTDDPERKEELENKLKIARLAIEKADARNRQVTDFLPPGSFVHGMPSKFLELALENGNLSGELLGPGTRTDASGLLGVDLSKVIGDDAPQKTFSERYHSLTNYGYGDVVLVYGQYDNKDREPYYSGAIGRDHYLIRGGIPTTEITSIILRNNDKGLVAKAKKDIATKGSYIPLVDVGGALLFSQEEFDQMRMFYYSLNKKGYPRAVIDNVFAYIASEKDEKHQIVIDSLQAHLLSNKNDELVDLAVLIDFLRSNDLNERPVEWYKAQSFNELYNFIRKTTGRKKRAKAREAIFGKEFSDAFSRKLLNGVENSVQPERQHNAFIDAFIEKQLPFVYREGETGSLEQAVFKNDLTSMLFREGSTTSILEIAQRFSEFKKEFMRTLWNKAWDKIGAETASEDGVLDLKKYIVPAVVGSVGRGEVVLGSDLDYLLYVDDVSEQISEEQLGALKQFINMKLGPIMNNLLEEQGIHADAGLAKADRLPFTLLSSIRDFKVELSKFRQVEEPTTMLDSDALFEEQSGTVSRTKELLLVENTTAHYLDSYIAKDLEIGTDRRPGYQAQFETLYTSVASGELMTHVKESLQRAVVFKLYYLLFEGFNSGKIPKDLAGSVPASVDGKIKLLNEYKILSSKEATTCRDLVAFAYKIRFLGEVYSEEAKQQKTMADKVTNVKFRLEDISYDERLHLVSLLKDFKSTVLYK